MQVQELREAMQEDKSIESAVYSTLYLDLVEGLRRQVLVPPPCIPLPMHASTTAPTLYLDLVEGLRRQARS